MSHNQALEKILFLDIEEQEKKEREENINCISIKTYVIVDASKIEKLTNELMALITLKYENLFTQEDEESLEEVAPYMIELKKEDDFTTWIYENVYGELGSLFIHSTAEIEELSEHFREYITTTMEVAHPKKPTEMMETKAYVRLYDPRVFPDFLQSLEDSSSFFYNIQELYVEDKYRATILKSFSSQGEKKIDLEGLLCSM